MMNKLRVLLIAIIILAVILTGITAFSVYENHELTINYQELYSQYEALQNKYEILKSNYTEILANYTNMKSQYGPLLSQYQSLQSNYYVLQQDYYVLQQNYENVSNLINAIMYGESGQGNATIDSGYQQYFGLVFVPYGCTLYGNIYVSSNDGPVVVYIMDWVNLTNYIEGQSWSYIYEWEGSSISESISLTNNEYTNDYYVIVIVNNNVVPVTVYEDFEPTYLVCSK
ncbi:hypothetical protein [Vulcanisaeta sp. JCM 16159]|uniref:hypothetical protein n=1 Tax=Vulcanisaeta sp. JCM 16159 TaxID=1295371 RepID=UPI001FB52D94|nr:hypothetical protein [Vulcanisaeta sp. JCM 16159]